MQFQQLAYFLAVAETRHFTHAAERMRVAQPSLSKQIKALEAELGAPLFSRARGNVTLTPAGEALLPLARRMLADAETARREVAELAGLRRGRVRLGATPSLCAGLLADVLARFHGDYPGVELQVEEGGSRDLVRDLARGQLDLALIILPLQSSDPSLVTEEILREDLVVASAAKPGRRPHIRIDELRGRPLVMFRRGYDLREATLTACRQAGFEPRFAVEGGEMDAVLRFVEAGLGVAVVPSMVLDGRPGLVGTPLLPGLRRTVALAHRKDVEPTRAAQAFRSELLSFLVEAAAGGTLSPGIEALTPQRPIETS
ncbi:LysR substrate-binding domain-containing protein [Planotetraspora phitsanulokensis]|uniref:LysR family transcriptional regulator n=1 Tax=Planotetraspora phitsanulokensis TaxID=575192 RepID=A0A8J3U310_9ACTN|nr:LysR substrate-binding domain-containing protein [Planotetraspora phitsanulokensis]GII37285.1 LysR family transcriptional regulator [Planotetraspora phitsanulokensis]